MTQLHFAAYCNDPGSVYAQLQQGVFVDTPDDYGWTALHWSIDMAQAGGEPLRVVYQLLAAGASANSVDQSGVSVLMLASGRNNQEIFEQLIKAGADVHLRSALGTTALHEAAGCNFSKAIQRLLVLGADPNQVDDRNRTPEQIAEQCGFDDSLALLKAARLGK